MSKSYGSSTFETYVEFELVVNYDWYCATRGARDSFNGRPGAGIQLEPDEPGGVEITSVMLGTIDILSQLTDSDIEKLEIEISEQEEN